MSKSKRYILYNGLFTDFGSNNAITLILQAVRDGIDELTFGICSRGGDVAGGMAVYEVLKQAPCVVRTYNAGMANSIAATVFMAGAVRVSPAERMFMLHGATYSEGPKLGTIAPSTMSIAAPFRQLPKWNEEHKSGLRFFGPPIGERPQPAEVEGVHINAIEARELGIVTQINRISFDEFEPKTGIQAVKTT